MRYTEIIEGEIVDLGAHRFGKAAGEYASSIQQIIKSSGDQFSGGNKFLPFARTYIASDFNPKYKPNFFIDVQFRDYKLLPEAKVILDQMKKEKWEIIRNKYAKNYSAVKQGPLARKDNLSFDMVRSIWEQRGASPYGAYQRSRHGFRSTRIDAYNEHGLGFSILVEGRDDRHQKFGEPIEEYHIIDDESDWAEVVEMMAMINRRSIKGVP